MIIPLRRKRDRFLPWAQVALDGLVIFGTLSFVFWLRFKSGVFSNTIAVDHYAVYEKTYAVAVLCLVYCLRNRGLYRSARQFRFSEEIYRVIQAVLMSLVILTAITFFVRDYSYSRTFLIGSCCVLAGTLSLARYLMGLVILYIDERRGSQRNVLAVGYDEGIRKAKDYYQKNPRHGARVVALLSNDHARGTKVDAMEVLGGMEQIDDILRHHRDIHEVLLSSHGTSQGYFLRALYACEKNMVTFQSAADLTGLIISKMSVNNLGHVQILSFNDSPLSDIENRFIKRAVDLVLSVLMLLMLSPLLVIISILIKIDSRGGIFYKQQRVGEDGRKFDLIKFRTMRPDAETATGPVWTQENDHRKTKLGAYLRKTNLDELPQLWNVLVGDMSLVGPRPERPFFVSQFKEDIPRYMARHSIRSGITGWAQVNGLRGNTSIEERTKFDLYYIENWSLALDFKILLMTLKANKNAY